MTYNELRVGHILQENKRVWCVCKNEYALFLYTYMEYKLEGSNKVTQNIHFLPIELM